ncbi:MAG: HEAT repeat domain-containing protein [Verrucomicrobiota bacterium]
MGTNAIPFLLKILSYEESPTRKWLRKTTRKLPFHLRLLEQDNTKSLEAAEAINAIGPGAESAFSPLTNLFLSGKSLTAGIALAGLGKNGVLFLISNLTNQNLVICNTTALSLGSSRSDFDIIVPALIKILNDGTSPARSVAAISLGSLHHSPDLVIPILLDNLNSSNQIVGSYVIMALSEYGTNAKAAIPLLIKMTNDSDAMIREHAKNALEKISPTSSDKKSK